MVHIFGPAFTNIFEILSWLFCIADDLVVISGFFNLYDTTGAFELFIRPVVPSHCILLQHSPETIYPMIAVLPCLTAIDGNLVFVAEVEIILNDLFCWCCPVFMKLVDQPIVKWRTEGLKVRIPLRSSQDDDMIFIYRPDSGGNPFIQGFQPGIEMRFVEIMRDRFIQQVVP